MSSRLDLLIPCLLSPPASTARLPHCEILELWLSRARQMDAESSYFSQLFSLLGMSTHSSAAWLSALADDCDQPSICWRADPVHFQAGTDHAVLLDQHRLDIQQNEAEQLAVAFNAHFAVDGLKLVTPDPNRWYMQFSQDMNLKTTLLHDAIGRNVRHFLPAGEQALQWRKWLNEAQMLFHVHPVNQQREMQGKLAINGLWLWGEGIKENSRLDSSIHVYASDAVARGAAIQAKQAYADKSEWTHEPQHTVLVLDDLLAPASYGDADEWSVTVESLCEDWVKKIHNSLCSGRIAQLNIYPADGRCFVLYRSDLNKIWRWRRPLSHWIHYDS